ncbi:helix-turn-helix domain-containing protein [Mesorhizobium sp. M3A.F.Ca.ET.080.04.2.1]|uniref:helix-turn-helix domain-containing protein n=1 Tax=Mesorhizobium sp. M3A.F.Ca.ET.080.04.2.1 TaxID=2493676 RepID=UPI000F75EB0B|nr:helix-turn-helix domain-containing protein [Mesorhizobium sp. M3A.F.Ca.ET.080.04.2.1]AZO09651.1 helix-turn-helix domain-containing protein [Mesorhizobium sp. M3A.F.Ca.ET.080.04.2.1]RWF24160.1 MAG: helix-turn-helix domain-containing protein [Mesorhizobium sp.]TGT57654.1 helix-turn-helix domain-containing protein [Mesorhizobium sp. M00.F.Ca.ET.170.01.1.1]
MADQKIFAGPRIRRLRNAKGLTQTAMAEGLGISPSYLNLIERNQRPLTVQLILKLASVYKVDPHELQGETKGSIAALREVFGDPLLVGELPGDQELVDLVEAAPNASAAMIKLFRAYREQAERLSDLNELLAREGRATALSGTRLPIDEVHEVLERRPNHFAALEEEAGAFTSVLDPGDDLFAALKSWLKREHGIVVKVLPVATMPNWRRRYDRHSQRLFLSERLSPFDQLREVAMEACLIRMTVAVANEIKALKLGTDEARRLARFELGRYAAHALMMPYQAFHAAAVRARYDIDVLRSRFGVSFEQAANRLTMLQRPALSGVPFFMLEVDNAGNRFRKAGSQGYPQSRFGGGCPKLPIHAAFSQPGRILVEAVEMPDGAEFLCIARTLEGPQGAFSERPRRTALLLGCDIAFRDEIVYGGALPATVAGKTAHGQPSATPVGPACRLCERVGCLARAEPPVTRPLGLDEMVTGLSAFDFQG